jgi:hypothetical protein
MAEEGPRVKRTLGSLPLYLEPASITKTTVLQYLNELGLLSGYSIYSNVGAAVADAERKKFINASFPQGQRPWVGEKALAARLMLVPTLS